MSTKGHFSKLLERHNSPDPLPPEPVHTEVPQLPFPPRGAVIRAPSLPSDQAQNPDFDTSNPRSLINLLPTYLRARLNDMSPDLFAMSERELNERVESDFPQNATVQRLRISFWDEYDRVQRYNEHVMDMTKVCRGVCTTGYFSTTICRQDILLAFILTPPEDYTIALRDIHTMSLRNLRYAVTLPIVDEKGRPNVKLIEAQNKIFQHVDLRLKGAIIQRIDQRNVNVNLNQPGGVPPEAGAEVPKAALTMEEINRQIAALEQKSRRLEAPSGVRVDLSPASPDIIEANVVEKGKA